MKFLRAVMERVADPDRLVRQFNEALQQVHADALKGLVEESERFARDIDDFAAELTEASGAASAQPELPPQPVRGARGFLRIAEG